MQHQVTTLEDKIQLLEQENQELKHKLKDLKTSKQILEQSLFESNNIIDSIPDFICLLDKNFTIIRINRAFAKELDMDPCDVVGQKCYELVHEDGQIPEYCPFNQVLSNGTIGHVEICIESIGGYKEIIATPYLDPDGTLIGAVYILRDINKRKTAERERDHINIQLLNAQKLEAVGRLAAGIAHEINTPTQYVASNLEFFKEAFQDMIELIDRYQQAITAAEAGQFSRDNVLELQETLEEIDWDYLKSELPQALEQAQDGVERVTKIVRAMKEFSHPGTKEKTLQDINKIIKTTVTIARNEWKYVSDVELRLQEDLPLVPCLSDEIGQVILNMLVNAAHAISQKLGDTPEDEKGRITITTASQGDHVQITISDTGIGIPKEIHGKVFEPFFTTKEVGKGTGQGLAIARNVVVKKHGGQISFQSELDKGTTFYIYLPLAQEEAS